MTKTVEFTYTQVATVRNWAEIKVPDDLEDDALQQYIIDHFMERDDRAFEVEEYGDADLQGLTPL